jgi:glycosyltransferase involved in cell wall biosynthesis
LSFENSFSLKNLPMSDRYTLIVPSLDRTGPVNVAVDIGRAASQSGWNVCILYLSNLVERDDVEFAVEVRRFVISDLWQMKGVVHTHCLRPDLLGLLLYFNKNVFLLTTIHMFFLLDLGFLKKNPIVVNLAWMFWRLSLSCFDKVVCISESMREYYTERIPSLNFEVIYNFRSEPSDIQCSSDVAEWIQTQKVNGKLVLVFAGVLSERKNVYHLLKAVGNTPSISLIVCGDGPMRSTLEELITYNRLYDRVRLEGLVAFPASIVRLCDALVLPSHAEGFPLVVLEAAAVGVPALLSNIDVHRELENIGFGRTFDHILFFDFEDSAHQLCRTISAPSALLFNLWKNRFKPDFGFRQYENLISPSFLRGNSRSSG